MKKIVVIGLGNVGFTYVNVSVARGIEAEWVFIDKNKDLCDAHAHDFQDMVAVLPRNGSTFRAGTFADAKGADIAVVCASIPAGKDMSDRLALAGKNAELMKSFTEELKNAGFKGVFIVAANPCDVMAAAIHYAGNYPFKKVISAGTTLDSARMKKFIAQRFNIAADSVNVSVLGEHGGSAFVAWSQAKIGDINFKNILKTKRIKKDELDELEVKMKKEGFYIWERKGNTQFGIATSLYEITQAVLLNKRTVMNIGVKLPSSYKHSGVWISIPVIVGENGYEYLPTKPTLSDDEWAKFEKSSALLAKVHNETLNQIGIHTDIEE
ncbi:lactate/malate family dehydrogenase [Mycoplasma phocoenae]|uniref:L-lactate dehydrogenase n=1 Tax=Mycoplasma phocoenae TaxID=754517 RepID=A0A858U7X0_9MOLU|nr:L-lactate dehydrogenase [Mycoplasma phocoenae]QJG66868.1 L-lactate dehydrogenase [Mycoplasma phocoenae]